MLIKYDPSNIEQTIAAAMLVSGNTENHASYEQSVLNNQPYDVDLHEVESPLTFVLEHMKNESYITDEDREQYANIIRQIHRIDGCDPHIPLDVQAFIFDLHQRAYLSLQYGKDFYLSYFGNDQITQSYRQLIKAVISTQLTNKIQHLSYQYRESILGFHIGKKQTMSVNVINAQLALAPWLLKYASLSLNNLVVYETLQSGIVYRGRGFNPKGEEDVQYFLHELNGRVPR